MLIFILAFLVDCFVCFFYSYFLQLNISDVGKCEYRLQNRIARVRAFDEVICIYAFTYKCKCPVMYGLDIDFDPKLAIFSCDYCLNLNSSVLSSTLKSVRMEYIN